MTEHILDSGGIIAAVLQPEWFSYAAYLLSVHNQVQIVSENFPILHYLPVL